MSQEMIKFGYKAPVKIVDATRGVQGVEEFYAFLTATYGVPVHSALVITTPVVMQNKSMNVLKFDSSKFGADCALLMNSTTMMNNKIVMYPNTSGIYVFQSYLDEEYINAMLESWVTLDTWYAVGYILNASDVTADDVELYQFGTVHTILPGADIDLEEDRIPLQDVFTLFGSRTSSDSETQKATVNLQEPLPVQKHMTWSGAARDITREDDYVQLVGSLRYDKWHPRDRGAGIQNMYLGDTGCMIVNEDDTNLLYTPQPGAINFNLRHDGEEPSTTNHRPWSCVHTDDTGAYLDEAQDTRDIRAKKHYTGRPNGWSGNPDADD